MAELGAGTLPAASLKEENKVSRAALVPPLEPGLEDCALPAKDIEVRAAYTTT